jgi:O-acetyl-ADP-ribose deacetylase (regulator of RNase III)
MIRVVRGDLGATEAEGLVRSVSAGLDPDTAVSRELEVRAGQEVSDRLQAMGDLPVGAAVITPGGDLAAGFLIHVVLFSREEPVTRESVRAALQNGLRRAEEWDLKTLAVPPLGIGAGNMDPQEAAAVMVPLMADFLRKAEAPREIEVVVGSEYEEEVFSRAVDESRKRMSLLEN